MFESNRFLAIYILIGAIGVLAACAAPAAPTAAPTSLPPTQPPPTTTAPTTTPTAVPPTTARTVASTAVPPTLAPTTAPTAVPPTAAPAASALKEANHVDAGFVSAVGWSSAGKTLTVHTEDAITLYNVADLSATQVISPSFASQVFALSPDGTKVVGLAADKTVQEWSTSDGKSVLTLQKASEPLGAFYSPDGSLIALPSADQIEITLYSAASGDPIKTLSGFQTAAPVYSGVLSPDNKTLAWVSRATVQFQDVASGALGAKLSFEDFVGASQFTPDSKMFITATGSNLQVWNVADGKELQKLTTPQFFTTLSVSPTGTLLATATGGNSILSWDWSKGGSGTEVAASGQISLVSFSPDGKMLASGDQSGTLTTWNVP